MQEAKANGNKAKGKRKSCKDSAENRRRGLTTHFNLQFLRRQGSPLRCIYSDQHFHLPRIRLVEQQSGAGQGPQQCYRGTTREGSWRKRLRYAAISVATVLKSFTLSRRMSLMICFRPSMYLSRSSGVFPSRREPIWTRILSSAKVNTEKGQHPNQA